MSKTDKDIQKNNYFEFRKVDKMTYLNYQLPLWILNELTDKNLKILDYGCGYGQNLNTLISNGFSNVKGIDIEKNAIAHCLQNNLDVKEIDLNNLINPFNIKFDVIILSHIIEHIKKEEIIITLSKIKDYFLVDGGKLLIAVPNAQSATDSYWAYEDWTHTTLFTSGSIYYVLKAAGFSKIEFLDINCTLGMSPLKKGLKKILLAFFKFNKLFWNKVTNSSYHKTSPQIFSFEIKVKASD